MVICQFYYFDINIENKQIKKKIFSNIQIIYKSKTLNYATVKLRLLINYCFVFNNIYCYLLI